MLELDQCLHHWLTEFDQLEADPRDYKAQVLFSTIGHLVEYKKLKERVNVLLPLGPDNAPRK